MPHESSPLSTTSAGLPWKVSWQHCRGIHLRYGSYRGRGQRVKRAEGEKGWGEPGQPSSIPQPERVLLALRRYLRAEQKEQRHTLRHYQHVAAVDPEKAQQMRFQVLRLVQLPNTLLSFRPQSPGAHPSDSSLVPQALFLSLRPSYPWNTSPFCVLGPFLVPQTLLPAHLPPLPIIYTIFLMSYTYHVSCAPLVLATTPFSSTLRPCPRSSLSVLYLFSFSLYSASPPPISFFLWPNSWPLYPTSYCTCYFSLNPLAFLTLLHLLSFPISSPHCLVHSSYSLPDRCRPTFKSSRKG